MIDPMQDLGRAIDLWIGECARRRLSVATRTTYRIQLNDFADTLPPYTAVNEITVDDVRRYLDRWIDAEPNTMNGPISNLRGFFRFLIDEGQVAEPGPMHRVKRVKRKRAIDLDVVTISEREANLLIAACETWQELLCISTGLYTGRRRAALNAARRRDVDLERGKHGVIRFRDKGDKVILQPVPAEYARIIRSADEKGVWGSPGEYLIPSRRPSTVTKKLRKDSVIWDTVKIVAARAGVESHVHALRAAFAVRFDDQHPDRLDTLRELMGHVDVETTLVYLRRKDRERDMTTVVDLSWGLSPFIPAALEGDPGSSREESEGEETPLFAGVSGVRPIRDSNPCSDETQEQSGDGDDEPPLRRSALDRKLDELEARRTRAGRRIR